MCYNTNMHKVRLGASLFRLHSALILTSENFNLFNMHVYMQGVSKGLVAKRLLSTMQERGMSPDFVVCIGDDRSDEDMFEVIISSMSGPSIAPRAEVFACTVGRKPSKAKYYLDDPVEIVRLMQGLASVSEQMITM